MKKNQKGFTLLELLVVLVILKGLMGCVLIYSVSTMQEPNPVIPLFESNIEEADGLPAEESPSPQRYDFPL